MSGYITRNIDRSKGDPITASHSCPPCAGHCKQGVICLEGEKASRILSAICEGRGEGISDQDIIWALCVTGDIPVVE